MLTTTEVSLGQSALLVVDAQDSFKLGSRFTSTFASMAESGWLAAWIAKVSPTSARIIVFPGSKIFPVPSS